MVDQATGPHLTLGGLPIQLVGVPYLLFKLLLVLLPSDFKFLLLFLPFVCDTLDLLVESLTRFVHGRFVVSLFVFIEEFFVKLLMFVIYLSFSLNFLLLLKESLFHLFLNIFLPPLSQLLALPKFLVDLVW